MKNLKESKILVQAKDYHQPGAGGSNLTRQGGSSKGNSYRNGGGGGSNRRNNICTRAFAV